MRSKRCHTTKLFNEQIMTKTLLKKTYRGI